MRTETELKERLAQYTGTHYFYNPEIGYIAWQCSTGENIEIMFIEVKEKGKGNATFLLMEMMKHIQPYHSIFVFRRVSNISAKHFYRKMGFHETKISGLYLNEDAVLGVVKYAVLKHKLGI